MVKSSDPIPFYSIEEHGLFNLLRQILSNTVRKQLSLGIRAQHIIISCKDCELALKNS